MTTPDLGAGGPPAPICISIENKGEKETRRKREEERRKEEEEKIRRG